MTVTFIALFKLTLAKSRMCRNVTVLFLFCYDRQAESETMSWSLKKVLFTSLIKCNDHSHYTHGQCLCCQSHYCRIGFPT